MSWEGWRAGEVPEQPPRPAWHHIPEEQPGTTFPSRRGLQPVLEQADCCQSTDLGTVFFFKSHSTTSIVFTQSQWLPSRDRFPPGLAVPPAQPSSSTLEETCASLCGAAGWGQDLPWALETPRSGAVGPCGAAGGPSARRGGGARVSLRVGICSSALPAENARFVRHGHSWGSLGEGAMERAGLCRGSWPLCCLQHSCFLVSGRSPRTQLLHPSSSRKLWGLQDLVSKLSVYWDLGGLLITPGLVIPGVPALVSTAEFAGVFWWDWDPAQPQRPALLCFVGTKAAVGAGHPRLCQHGPLPAHRAGQPGSPAPSVAGEWSVW